MPEGMIAEPPVRLRGFGETLRAGFIERFPEAPDDGLFQRVARQAGIAAPQVGLAADDEGRRTLDRYCYRVWGAYPAWGYCTVFLGEHCRPVLPRVLAEIGLGAMLGFVSDDIEDAFAFGITLPPPAHARAWGWPWVVKHAPRPHLVPLTRRMPGCPDPGLCFRLTREADAPLIFLGEGSHRWWCPALARKGACLVDLAAWRWDVTPAKAARRIGRILGLGRLVP
jgi:hypothetical protein